MAEKLRPQENEPPDVNPEDAFNDEPDVRRMAERYAEGTEMSDGTKKVVDGLLSRDADALREQFALKWFEDNSGDGGKMKKEGFPVDGVDDKYKISFVLARWQSQKEGGWGIGKEMRGEEYGEEFGDKIDKIQTLKIDMAEKDIPPETPFLMLNYLQNRIKSEQARLEELKVMAEAGDARAGLEAISGKKQLEELFSAQKEMTEKTMRENLTEMAEKKVAESGFETKEQRVSDDNIKAEAEKIEKQRNKELMDIEWQEYMSLPEKQRVKYQNEILGRKAELPRDAFDRMVSNRNYTPEQADEAFKKYNREMFEATILMCAREKNDIEGPAFYGLLQQGLKPHEKHRNKGTWLLGQRMRTVIPKKGGGEERVLDKDYDEFVKKSGEDYTKNFALQAKGELEIAWDKEHDQKVRAEIEKRIAEVSVSIETATGGIERKYQEARDRIMLGYIRKRAEKNPEAAKRIQALEKGIEEGGKDISIGDVINDTLRDEDGRLKGRFNNGGRFKKGLQVWGPLNKVNFGILEEYLVEDLGLKVSMEAIKEIVTEDKYNKAFALANKTGFFQLLLEIVGRAYKVVEKKVKVPKRKAA